MALPEPHSRDMPFVTYEWNDATCQIVWLSPGRPIGSRPARFIAHSVFIFTRRLAGALAPLSIASIHGRQVLAFRGADTRFSR